MKEFTFKNFQQFADFLENNRDIFKFSPIKGFIDATNTIRKTHCGSCKRRNIEIADSTYRNLFDVLTEIDKENIKNLLNVDNVIFLYEGNPMYKI